MESANCRRSCIQPGMTVDIVLKKDQPTGILTRGTVGRLLTNKSYHPRGIKVMLTDGQVGRVQKIISESQKEGAVRHPLSRFGMRMQFLLCQRRRKTN